METSQKTNLSEILAYPAWLIALLATIGSLFFSEVMLFPPCVLCWYQRIAIYPLVLIIGAGIILRDEKLKYYALPVSLSGLLIAIYHNLLYYGIIPESAAPCTEGASCTETHIEWLGFVTIPLLSLAAFAVISVCLFFYKPSEKINRS